MTRLRVYESGEKSHTDENFPVASYLIRKPCRGPVLAFYRFARAADDVADHPHLTEAEKLSQLDAFEATLLNRADSVPAALPLRRAIAERGLSPRHALDLLTAFRQDARKPRYQTWNELMDYCAHSAAPVGRFVLDLHGEDKALWPASDTLCAALQIINHLQDCKADYLRLNRIYIPQENLSRYGIPEHALAAARASEPLRACLAELARKTQRLLQDARFSMYIKDKRLGLEVAVIERLAEKLLQLLWMRDPLSERVHLRKYQLIPIIAREAFAALAMRVPK